MFLLAALVPSFDLGDTRNFVVPLDEHAWFGGTTIVSAIAVYLGWFWWTVSAAFNVRRVSPLSTSPLLPDRRVPARSDRACWPAWRCTGRTGRRCCSARSSVLGVGHVMVVGSFRSAASRIGRCRDEFAKLLWLPMAGVTYRLFVNVVRRALPTDVA